MDGRFEVPHQQLAMVAKSWITWPERLALGAVGHPQCAPDEVWPHFETHVRTIVPYLRAVDRLDSIREFREGCKSLHAVYQAVLSGVSGTLVFDDGQPLLQGDPASGYLSSWLAATASLDPDSLVALHAVTCGHDLPLEDMKSWKLTVSSGDRDLLRLFAKGLADLHLHLGGTRFIPLLWQRKMALPNRIDDSHASEPMKFSDTVDDRMLAVARRVARGECCGACFSRPRCASCTRQRGELEDSRRVRYEASNELTHNARHPEVTALLVGERRFYLEAWAELRRQPIYETLVLAQRLDTYLTIKGKFRQQNIQSTALSTGGLEEFDRYLKSTREAAPGRTRRERFAGKGYWLRGSGSVLRLLREHPYLRRVELRIAPESRVADYVGTVRTFNRILRDIEESPTTANSPARRVGDRVGDDQMALAIHFIRTRKREGSPREGRDRYLSKRMEVDAQSGALHAFRQRREYAQEARRIVRIDVAGQERHSPSQIFAPYFLLLRGDERVLSLLESDKIDRSCFALWYRLRDQNRHRSRFGACQLGFTVHAGEDYFLPLDGLYEVAMAVERFQMQPGDAIGHALAAGVTESHLMELARRRPLIPAGVEFESFLWLHRVLSAQARSDPLMGRLEAYLRQKVRELTKRSMEPAELHPLVSAANTAPPSRRKPDQLESATEEFLQARFFDEDTRSAYFTLAPAHGLHQELGSAFSTAQEYVINLMLERGVMVETNPSSSCRVLGGIPPEELPIFRMIERSDGRLRVTIGSDDPAVFDTWVGNEYALFFEGYLARNGAVERQRGLELLERIRRQGLDHVNWG